MINPKGWIWYRIKLFTESWRNFFFLIFILSLIWLLVYIYTVSKEDIWNKMFKWLWIIIWWFCIPLILILNLSALEKINVLLDKKLEKNEK